MLYFLAINILPHTDCLTIFVEKLCIPDKAVFFVKGQHTLIMLYVGVHGEETGGAIGRITGPCKAFRAVNHKSSNAFVFSLKAIVNGQLGDFHGRYGFEWIVEVVEFLLGE
jgi:hypothetical protein